MKLDEPISVNEQLQVPKHADTDLGCSPSLPKDEVLKIPLSKHELTCNCYMCRNVSVQAIWLMYGQVQAKINALRFFVHDSHATYKQIVRFCNFPLFSVFIFSPLVIFFYVAV